MINFCLRLPRDLRDKIKAEAKRRGISMNALFLLLLDESFENEGEPMSNAVSPLQPRLSIVESVARQYGMERAAFEATLRATVVPPATTREEFAAFLLVAKQYGLNPILREIYAFPKRGGGIQPIVGVDGWAKLMNREAAFDGMAFHDVLDDDGRIVSVTCRIFRKDRAHPVEATEYLVECHRETDVWRKWPRRMLRHKAMIQAARYAFGFSGIVDPDEVDRFGGPQHDPAMLQAQMQLTGPDQSDEPDDLPVDTPGHITTHPDYVAGQRDYKANRHEPHGDIEMDETRFSLWKHGYDDAYESEGHRAREEER